MTAAFVIVALTLGTTIVKRLVVRALLFGIAMVPLGEFNIVPAQAGEKAGRLDATELATCVGVTLTSIVLATLVQPLVLRMSSARPRERAASC